MVGWTLGGVALAAFLVVFYPTLRDGAAEFQQLLEQLPSGMLDAMGIDPATFVTAKGYVEAELYNLLGPVLVIIYAVQLGGAAAAKEEHDGTADLVFTLPISRASVLVQKVAAGAVLLALLVATFLVVLLAGDPLYGMGLRVVGIVGINVALYSLGVFFGSLAFAAAAWSGRKGLGAGLAGVVAMLSFLLDGFAQIVDWLGWADRITPFDWYLRGDPLSNGAGPWQLFLIGLALVLVAAGTVVFESRDIGVARNLPRLRFGRRRGTASTSSSSWMLGHVWSWSVWIRRRSLRWWIVSMAAFTSLILSVYPSVRDLGGDQFGQLIEAYPTELLAVFGITDPASALEGPGLVSSRIHGSIGLVAVLVLGIGFGARAIAGEERAGTIDLVLTGPVRRGRFVIDKAIGLVATVTVVVAAGILAPMLVGAPLVDLGVTAEGMIAGNLGMILLVVLYGSLALAAGAWTGRPGIATGIATVAAVAGHLVNGFGAFVDWLAPARRWSPFYWYAGPKNPLSQELGWQQPLLAAVALLLVVVAVVGLQRRDVGV